MLFELDRHEYSKVHALLGPHRNADIALEAVLAGSGNGTVYVDRREAPRVGLVNALGIGAYFVGDARHPGLHGLDAFVEHTLKPLDQAQCGATCFIGIALDDAWCPALETVFAHRDWEDGYDHYFRFDPRRFARLSPPTLPPSGYRLQPIDRALLVHPDNAALRAEILEFWPSCAAFLAGGCGFAICHGATAVSVCYSCYAHGGHHELAVRTYRRALQRRGFATRVCHAYLMEATRRGWEAHWTTDAGNVASLRLADKCGFVFEKKVRSYEFEY
ncbi:GNAT family N-acetyltransferase [Chitiniphilus purpureus]|uniref:GNAT family N-acetyltransferase n=1 Tax=Chitiniphilus purpureus TaxID=2981137 RepID=A0ABY6DKN3_9NEIS|nr:GNAT family N-acetyltransferase [Chitiniphilus sp. CD1]UXY14914.1 GNAT family N-acetyltransferase [Chitiniphilus sp. CD1]